MAIDHNSVEIDPILHALGPSSLFFLTQCLLYFMVFTVDAHQFFSFVFTGREMGHKCAPLSNTSLAKLTELYSDWDNSTLVHYGQCSISVTTNVSGSVVTTDHPCINGMEYDAPKDLTFVSEFDLVCSRAALSGLTQTLNALGMGAGSLLCPWLSDLYGRKASLVISLNLVAGVSLMTAFAPSYLVFAIGRFLSGLLIPGLGLVAVTAVIEIFPTSLRGFISGFVSTLFWACGVASLSPLAYLFRNFSWRVLHMFMAGSSILSIVEIIFMKEPLRWLMANGKMKMTEKQLDYASRLSKKNPGYILQLFRDLLDSSTDDCFPALSKLETNDKDEDKEQWSDENHATMVKGSPQPTEVHLGFIDMFRHPLMRKNLLILSFIWFTDSLAYGAMYLTSGSLSVGLYVGFFINATVEGASCVLMVILLKRYSRLVTIGVFKVIGGVFLIGSSVCHSFSEVESLTIVATVFSFVAMMGVAGSFNLMFLYTPEIFPTAIRNRALGISMAISTGAAMFAPFAIILIDYAIWAPGAIFGSCNVIAVFLLLLMPETAHRELPQTIQDLESWYHVTPVIKA